MDGLSLSNATGRDANEQPPTPSLLQDGEVSAEAATWTKDGTKRAGKVWRNIRESFHVVYMFT